MWSSSVTPYWAWCKTSSSDPSPSTSAAHSDWAPRSRAGAATGRCRVTVSRTSKMVRQQVSPFWSPGTSAAESARTRHARGADGGGASRRGHPTREPPGTRRRVACLPIRPSTSLRRRTPRRRCDESGPASSWMRRTTSRLPSPSRSTVSAFTVMSGRTCVASSAAASGDGTREAGAEGAKAARITPRPAALRSPPCRVYIARRPRRLRAITIRWISLVPSPISVSLASRR